MFAFESAYRELEAELEAQASEASENVMLSQQQFESLVEQVRIACLPRTPSLRRVHLVLQNQQLRTRLACQIVHHKATERLHLKQNLFASWRWSSLRHHLQHELRDEKTKVLALSSPASLKLTRLLRLLHIACAARSSGHFAMATERPDPLLPGLAAVDGAAQAPSRGCHATHAAPLRIRRRVGGSRILLS